ncbi:MAG: SPOR domain-containing protein, partial [Pseudomonadota bacterium]
LRGADYSDPVHGDLGYGAPSHPADPTELNADPYRLDAYAPASLPAADHSHQQYDHATGAAPGFGRRGAIVGAAATAYGDAGHNEPDFGHHEAHYGAKGYDQSGGQSGGLQPHETAYVDDEDEFEDETPAKGRRSQTLVYVAASLIGAVVLGGGAAFAYKNFVGNGGAQTGPVSPIIRAGSDDTKATPTKPGGTRFAHKDSKLLGRLDSANPARGGSTQARSRAAADRVRTVSTHVVRPDGTLVPSGGATATRQPARPAPQAAAAPSIPGMVIDGLPRIPTGSVSTTRAPAGAARTIAPTTPRAPSRQIQVARVQPRTAPVRPSPVRPSTRQAPSSGSRTVAPIVITRPRAPSAPAVAAPAAQQTSQRAVRPAATRTRGIPLPTRNTFPRRTRTASLAPSTVQPSRVTPAGTASVRQPVSAPATPAATSIAAGYGVVLASQNSRLAALQTFVDLRQRFAGVLGNRIPDVQEADLSSRGLGTVYRLVVGPPGSREAANTLCQQLKSGGYQDCWVKRY